MSTSANTPLDGRAGGVDDGEVLLPRLLAVVEAFHEQTDEPMWSIAARARMSGAQLSATLKAGKPKEEGGSDRAVSVVVAERIAGAVGCDLMPIPKELVPEVERLLAAAKGGRS